jgi:two-component system cell cycle response regulator
MNTLLVLKSKSSFRLYQVLTVEPTIELGLLSYASPDNIIISDDLEKQELPERCQYAVMDIIKTGQIISISQSTANPEKQIIYPAHDANEQIFAILIQTTKLFDKEVKHIVHGLLCIYSNYLELIDISKRDKLTGLLNRETLESEIARILTKNNRPQLPQIYKAIENDARHYNEEQKHWLCILDIDYFKAINDKYGHLYGDEILMLIARFLEKSVRYCDKIFRFGGEEFVIIIENFEQHDALLAFERIRNIVKNHQYARVHTLTVSIGATEITHNSTPRHIIANADKALYYAKQHGRDQVQIYETLLGEGKITKQENYLFED